MFNIKAEKLREALAERGISNVTEHPWDGEKRLKKLLAGKNKNRLIYVGNTNAVPIIYRYAFEHSLVPGRDFELMGMASGFTFGNLIPSISFFKPAYYERGIMGARKLLGIRKSVSCDNKFIQGETMREIR